MGHGINGKTSKSTDALACFGGIACDTLEFRWEVFCPRQTHAAFRFFSSSTYPLVNPIGVAFCLALDRINCHNGSGINDFQTSPLSSAIA